jgi:hypothetical protein
MIECFLKAVKQNPRDASVSPRTCMQRGGSDIGSDLFGTALTSNEFLFSVISSTIRVSRLKNSSVCPHHRISVQVCFFYVLLKLQKSFDVDLDAGELVSFHHQTPWTSCLHRTHLTHTSLVLDLAIASQSHDKDGLVITLLGPHQQPLPWFSAEVYLEAPVLSPTRPQPQPNICKGNI